MIIAYGWNFAIINNTYKTSNIMKGFEFKEAVDSISEKQLLSKRSLK